MLAALFLSACGKAEPDDGGEPLELEALSGALQNAADDDPCLRKEHGHWHRSVGHCRPMTGPERIEGVWVQGFEISEFVPGVRSFSQAAAREHLAHDIEIDEERVQQRAGIKREGPGAVGYAIAFIGRRTRDPINVDCQGRARFAIVVDRLLSARDAGTEAPTGPITRAELEAEMARMRAMPVSVAVRHSGEWGKREAEAVARCRPRDQAPSHSSPSGNASAL
jgi:hypothetical protein